MITRFQSARRSSQAIACLALGLMAVLICEMAVGQDRETPLPPPPELQGLSCPASVICVHEKSLASSASVRQGWLHVTVRESEEKSIQVGHEVSIQFDSILERKFTGRVIKANPVLVSLVDVPQLIKAGLTANATIDPQVVTRLEQLHVEVPGIVEHVYEEAFAPDLEIRQAWLRLAAEDAQNVGLQVGTAVRVRVDAVPMETLLGEVISIEPAVVSVFQLPTRVKAGLTAVATIDLPADEN